MVAVSRPTFYSNKTFAQFNLLILLTVNQMAIHPTTFALKRFSRNQNNRICIRDLKPAIIYFFRLVWLKIFVPHLIHLFLNVFCFTCCLAMSTCEFSSINSINFQTPESKLSVDTVAWLFISLWLPLLNFLLTYIINVAFFFS